METGWFSNSQKIFFHNDLECSFCFSDSIFIAYYVFIAYFITRYIFTLKFYKILLLSALWHILLLYILSSLCHGFPLILYTPLG